MKQLQRIPSTGKAKTGVLWTSTMGKTIVDARALRQEKAQYGQRKPKQVKTVTVITRRNNETIRRADYAIT